MPQSVISLFLLFNLIAITSWALPWKFALLNDVRELARPYLLWSGLFQRWDMFAPTPPTIDTSVKAVVFTKDRHVRVWEFPRMEQLGYLERYRKEKYRKFAEVLPNPIYQAAWPDVASHLARRMQKQGDQPDQVMLIQFRSSIPPWNANPAPDAKPNVFYEGYITPGDPQ